MIVRMFPVGRSATLRQLEENPHPLLARLRAAEPVSWVTALGGWLVTRHDLAVRVMRDPTTFTVDNPRFSTSRIVGPSMLSLDGVEHARHASHSRMRSARHECGIGSPSSSRRRRIG